MAQRFSPILLAASLALFACSQAVNQTANIVVSKPSATPVQGPFSALGGSGLDPHVALFCQQGDISGDQGYARSLARQYRAHVQTLLKLRAGGDHPNSGSIYGDGITPSNRPSVLPSSEPTSQPSAQPTLQPTALPSATATAQATPTSDISVVEKTTLNGTVYDDQRAALDGVTISVRSLNASVPFQATATTAGGSFAFNNAPSGVSVEIIASRPGYTTRRRVEVLKSNKTGDPNANRYDFGTPANSVTAYGTPYNSLSDKPEITMVQPGRNQGAIDAHTPIVLSFSEPIDRDSVLNNFQLARRQADGSYVAELDSGAFLASWNADDTQLTLQPKPETQLAAQTDYRIAFRPETVLKDKTGTARSTDLFKLTDGDYEASSRFSVLSFVTAAIDGTLPAPTPLPPATKARDSYYFSYDDSASVAAVELTKQALRTGRLPKPEWARTWEFLNYEPFDHIDQFRVAGGQFQVSLGLWKYPHPDNPYLDTYEIGAHVTAPYQCKETRQPLNLTLLVDVSASMNEPAAVDALEGGSVPTKLALLKAGLGSLADSLRPGDVVHLLSFSNKPATLVDSYLVGKDPASKFSSQVEQLSASGGTELGLGLEAAFRQAQKLYDKSKLNRVLVMTDAKTNETGSTGVDMQLIQQMAARNNSAGIYLSALGMGYTHNQELLNQLTEAGRGAYYTIQTRADMQEAMHDRFLPLMSVIARNARFRLEFPGWLRHGKTAAEELSADPAKVQPTNFSANSSQYFWEQFQANRTDYAGNQSVKLTISYTDPLTGANRSEVFEKTLAEILGKDAGNLKAAHMVQLTTALIKQEITPEAAQHELDTLLADVGT